MTLKEQIEQDLKRALLGGDKERATTLRSIKSVILNVEIQEKKREKGLSDTEIVNILLKEQKKRQESAELYERGGASERAQNELRERDVISCYLPRQLDEKEIEVIVEHVKTELNASDVSKMGQVIGRVREQTNGQADGAVIARIVKEKLGK